MSELYKEFFKTIAEQHKDAIGEINIEDAQQVFKVFDHIITFGSQLNAALEDLENEKEIKETLKRENKSQYERILRLNSEIEKLRDSSPI